MAYYVKGYLPPDFISDSAQVRDMQKTLNIYGAGLVEDGVWGPNTKAAYNTVFLGASTPAQSYASDVGQYMREIQGLFHTPDIQYEAPSKRELEMDIAASLRPGIDLAIKNRREQTLKNRAELDVDSYARGMGSSTYISDVKGRQMDSEAEDILSFEAQYAATLAQLLSDALYKERQRAFEIEKFNAEQRRRGEELAFSAAQNALAAYTAQQLAAQKQAGRSGKKKDEGVYSAWNAELVLKSSSPEERRSIYEGLSADARTIRDQMIKALTPEGYMRMQAQYPAYQ